jgi:hypothetical protein
MGSWDQQVAQAEAAAQQLQEREAVAESRFDEVHAQAQARAQVHLATETPEFHDWMAARRATDSAWGAWSLVMDARPR